MYGPRPIWLRVKTSDEVSISLSYTPCIAKTRPRKITPGRFNSRAVIRCILSFSASSENLKRNCETATNVYCTAHTYQAVYILTKQCMYPTMISLQSSQWVEVPCHSSYHTRNAGNSFQQNNTSERQPLKYVQIHSIVVISFYSNAWKLKWRIINRCVRVLSKISPKWAKLTTNEISWLTQEINFM